MLFVTYPRYYAHIDLQTMQPHRKNLKIAKVFSQKGIVEESGCGMRKMFKYSLFKHIGQFTFVPQLSGHIYIQDTSVPLFFIETLFYDFLLIISDNLFSLYRIVLHGNLYCAFLYYTLI